MLATQAYKPPTASGNRQSPQYSFVVISCPYANTEMSELLTTALNEKNLKSLPAKHRNAIGHNLAAVLDNTFPLGHERELQGEMQRSVVLLMNISEQDTASIITQPNAISIFMQHTLAAVPYKPLYDSYQQNKKNPNERSLFSLFANAKLIDCQGHSAHPACRIKNEAFFKTINNSLVTS